MCIDFSYRLCLNESMSTKIGTTATKQHGSRGDQSQLDQFKLFFEYVKEPKRASRGSDTRIVKRRK